MPDVRERTRKEDDSDDHDVYRSLLRAKIMTPVPSPMKQKIA
jgi:hypothetical protein